MTFSVDQARGDAGEVHPQVGASEGHERESKVIEIVKDALEKIASELGGYVAVSANGHVSEKADPNFGGDNVSLQVNTIMPPDAQPQDAGAQAAVGSTQNYPPESSTAAPQPADGSPPAAQEPVPQPTSTAGTPVQPDVAAGQLFSSGPESADPAPGTTSEQVADVTPENVADVTTAPEPDSVIGVGMASETTETTPAEESVPGATEPVAGEVGHVEGTPGAATNADTGETTSPGEALPPIPDQGLGVTPIEPAVVDVPAEAEPADSSESPAE